MVKLRVLAYSQGKRGVGIVVTLPIGTIRIVRWSIEWHENQTQVDYWFLKT